MPRISEPKLIKNKEKYDQIFPKYMKGLDQLSKKYPVQLNLGFSELVNFKKNRLVSKHSWFNYKQGFSAEMVKRILLEDRPSKTGYILDPFLGVGTTSVVAQSLGFKSIGFDINPVAAFAARVKTAKYADEDLNEIEKYIKKFTPINTSRRPKSNLLEVSFEPTVFNKLMHIKGFYESIKNEKIRDYFKLAYLSIVEDCSFRVKDGNGIKLVKDKKYVRDVSNYYLIKCSKMLDDVKKENYWNEAIIFNESFLNDVEISKINKFEISEIIFSPPYANCFDYLEVYKLEMWMGEFVHNYSDFNKYRNLAIRSHVNSSFDHSIKNINEKVEVIADLVSCFNIWNRNLPDMIRGYFDDMTEIIKRLKSLIHEKVKCYIVVANSGYKGVLIPTDLLLAEIAESNGFIVKNIIYARKIRSSSQQMKEIQDSFKNIIRESIIVLERDSK